jgi:hypothetical protein
MTQFQIHTPDKVNQTVTEGQVPAGMVVVPKLRADGVVKMTAVDPFAIIGCEPSTLAFKGKKFDGTKIYTKSGNFKVFADPMQVLLAQHGAKAGKLATVEPMVAIPDTARR